MSNDLDGPLFRFSRSRHFYLEYLKYRAFYGQSFYRTLIGNHTQSINWNDTTFNDLEWPLNASRGFVSISWASCCITYGIDNLRSLIVATLGFDVIKNCFAVALIAFKTNKHRKCEHFWVTAKYFTYSLKTQPLSKTHRATALFCGKFSVFSQCDFWFINCILASDEAFKQASCIAPQTSYLQWGSNLES